MTNYDETDILKELLLEQVEQVEQLTKANDEMKAEIEELKRTNTALSKMVSDFKKPLLPLVQQLLCSLNELSQVESRSEMKSQKLNELLAKHRASKPC